MPISLPDLKDWHFSVDFEGIAWAYFDREGERMNSLSRRAMEELNTIIAAMEMAGGAGEVKGLVIMSGKVTGFVVGADIREFEGYTTEAEVVESVRQGTELFDRIERLGVPVVCAIHGFCLGGGLELAMACHYRIADREDKTRLGLPEVKLGIFPGLNGTVRSIRLAGPVAAMEMMLTGRMLRPSAARAMGLVDQLVPTHHTLRWAARRAVLEKRKSEGAPLSKRVMRKSPARGYLASQMRKKTAEKAREDHYPAPFRLIELFDRHGEDDATLKAHETAYFAPLMISDTSRNLRRVFRLSEMLKAQAGKTDFKPSRVHVIGAGTMGGDIAAWCVMQGMEVSLQDMNADAIGKALERAKGAFAKKYKSRAEVEAASARMLADGEGKQVPRADVIIEAIVERLDIKQKLFLDLEARAKPGAILATNTSSLPIEDIAEPLKDPSRLIGLHFFNPVAQLPLVEVIRGPQSQDDWVRKGAAFVAAIDKFPLIVKSCPGFLVNRVLAPYMLGAMAHLEKGIAKDKLDAAAREFGMPMGPIELADSVGLDVCKSVGEILKLANAEGSQLDRLVKAGKLGKKSGEGFYIWKEGKAQKADASYDKAELARLGRELMQPMLDECERCLADGIVDSADLVDAGVIFGCGFAPFRGGPLHFLNKTGASPSHVQAAAE